MSEAPRKRPRPSLAVRVLIGLVLGIAAGVFFGESMAAFDVLGNAFIRLLQMAVLPFIVVSLVRGLGGLRFDQAVSLARSGGALLLVIWAIALVAVLALPLTFPDWESADFFSTSLVEAGEGFDLLGLFIPANPFEALAESVVPAVVLFSVAVGLALIGVPQKRALLEALEALLEALTRITAFVVGLAPIGVFAIAASAAGTLEVAELGRLQVFVVGYALVALVLTFWVLPALVAATTPLGHREVVAVARDALITGFATGNLLIVLPVITERARQLLREAGDEGGMQATVDVIVPASFNFPSPGKLLSMSFAPFAGWFSGFPLSLGSYPLFLSSGFMSFFGPVIVAVPFLLDVLRIPSDTFELFVTVDVFTGRFSVLLAAMHTLVLGLLGAYAVNGRLSLPPVRIARWAATSALALAVVVGGVRALFSYGFDPAYQGYRAFVELELAGPTVPSRLLTGPPPPPDAPAAPRLAAVEARGTLRVCFFPDSLPFAFVNAANRVVGYDIAMAHTLARELGVELELLRVGREEAARALETGICDVAMSGLGVTASRTERVTFTDSYLDLTVAFIVEDYRREEFASRDAVKGLEGARIGVPNVPYYLRLLRDYLPDAEIVPVDGVRSYFTAEHDLDALAFAAEAGSAWTLIYPRYAVAVPLPDRLGVPLAYALPHGQREMRDYLDTWIALKRRDGTLDRLFEHWILGRPQGQREPRWSVVRDVLGWVD